MGAQHQQDVHSPGSPPTQGLDEHYAEIAREIHEQSRQRFGRSGKYFLLGSDALALVSALLLGRLLKWAIQGFGSLDAATFWGQHGDIRVILFGGLIVATVATFLSFGHYSQRLPFWDEMRDIWRILLTVAILDAAMVFLGKWPFSRLWFLDTWVLTLFLVPVFRVGTKRVLKALGGWNLPTAIIGTGPNAIEAAAALRSEPMMGYNVVAFLVPGQIVPPGKETIDLGGKSVPVLPLNGTPFAGVEALGKPHLVVALEINGLNEHQKLISALGRHYKDIHIAPAIRGLPLYGLEPLHFFSHEVLLLRARNNLSRRWARLAKRAFDVAGSLALLVVGSPLLTYIAIRVKRSGGSVLFAHTRVGRDGKEFKCLKFRTMVPNADSVLRDILSKDDGAREEWNRYFKLRDDPRVTAIGRFLRKTSFDELPQLWNVLKGDMSLVGPRPIIEPELQRYGDEAGYYLGVRPGITGLWQISGRSNTDYSARVNLDVWYVRNWSLWYDIAILLRTVGVVLRRDGAY